MICNVMNHSKVLTNHTCHWYYYYYVIRSCVICHGGSHASGACLNGNLHTKFIVFKWALVHDHYSLNWPTSVFVRECGLNLADAIMQRSMSHFGHCRYCYSGALLSGSGHCCPFVFGHLWISFTAPTLSQWSSSGNPVAIQCAWNLDPSVHWNATGKELLVASVFPVCFQWSSSGFPVVFQCVPIMQINTGMPLGQPWVLASASVVPLSSQCTCGSSGLPVCSNYAN